MTRQRIPGSDLLWLGWALLVVPGLISLVMWWVFYAV